jgi:PAS domain S-box-containing protein
VDRGTISRIELGHVSPRIDTISFLCEAMGTSLSHFFGAQGGPPGEAQDPSAPAKTAAPPAAETHRSAHAAEAQAHRPSALVPVPGPAQPDADGYWPVPSTFWHGLLEVLDRFEALVKNSSELIMVLDHGGIIVYASPACEAILGRRSNDLVGRHGRSLLHPSDLRRYEELLAALPPNTSLRLDFRLRHKDGSWRWLAGKFCNLLDNPSILGLVVNALETQGPSGA